MCVYVCVFEREGGREREMIKRRWGWELEVRGNGGRGERRFVCESITMNNFHCDVYIVMNPLTGIHDWCHVFSPNTKHKHPFFFLIFFPVLLRHNRHIQHCLRLRCTKWWFDIPVPCEIIPQYDWATSLSLFTCMHWRRKRQPTPVFLPGESRGRGSLVGCCLRGRTESDTADAT